MSRFDQADIAVELLELCYELRDGIIQQLNYYRASVYKEETGHIIDEKIKQLKMVVALLGDEEILDHFQDFAASKGSGNIAMAPGECYLSTRISQLFQGLEQSFQELTEKLQNKSYDSQDARQVTEKIKRHRQELLAICRHGSRQWAFFQTV